MKLSKKISLIASLAILLLCISNVAAYYERFNTFTGPNHNSSGGSDCHNGTNPKSPTAHVQVQCSTGIQVHAGDELTITVKVFSFMEAVGGGDETIVVGFPSPLSDNSAFTIDTAPIKDISVDGSGNSGTLTFAVDAPTSAGNYTLEAAALDGHGGEGNHLDWTSGVLSFNVTGTVPSAPWDTPTGLIAIIGIIAGFSALAIIAIAIAIRNHSRTIRANTIMTQGSTEDTRKKLGVKLKYSEDLPA